MLVLMSADYLLWVDVETTGLDPASDHLLEVAAILTTFDPAFEPIGQPFERVIGLPDVLFAEINQVVLEMHVQSGLWHDSRRSRATAQTVLDDLARWFLITKNNADIDFGCLVHAAGRSVHFDLAWLPDLRLHHRRFDLTPIKAFASMAGIEVAAPEDAHRALADVQADIALARQLVKAATA